LSGGRFGKEFLRLGGARGKGGGVTVDVKRVLKCGPRDAEDFMVKITLRKEASGKRRVPVTAKVPAVKIP